ncbi:MAG: acyloxyacyl hydrolase [Fluviicola sp.]
MRFVLILFLLVSKSLIASDSIREPIYLSYHLKGGYLAAHRSTMAHLAQERIFAGEISIKKRLIGSDFWHESYRNPFVGLTLYGSNLSNKEVLGNAFGAFSFIEFPWYNSPKNVFSCQMAVGLAYLTKTFDQQTNPKNVAVSSHFSASVVLGVTGHHFFTEKHGLEYGFDLTHFSNGSTQLPNLGINIPMIRLGYLHKIGSTQKEAVKQVGIKKTPFFNSWEPSLIGITSFKENWPTGGKKYPVFAMSAVAFKQFKSKVGMEVALDFISKQSLMDYKTYIPRNQLDIFQIGGYLGYAIPMNHLRFVIGMGYYIHDKFDADDELYHRLGMRYTFDNGLLLNFVLKTHWAKADYIEFGVGYNFKKKTVCRLDAYSSL